MAEGFLRHEAGDRYEVYSAGTDPAQVRPEAVQDMREIWVDISGQSAKPLSEFQGHDFDFVITVCDKAKKNCPDFGNAVERLHWPFDDPSSLQGSIEERLDAFRRRRDQIHARLMVFLGEGAYGEIRQT